MTNFSLSLPLSAFVLPPFGSTVCEYLTKKPEKTNLINQTHVFANCTKKTNYPNSVYSQPMTKSLRKLLSKEVHT